MAVAGGGREAGGSGRSGVRPDDPYRVFRFRVELGEDEYADGGKVKTAAFSQCSGIKAEMQVLRVRTGADSRGVQGIIPTVVNYSNVTLSRGVVADNSFLDWVFDCMPGYMEKAKNPVRRTIHIVVLNDYGEDGVRWTLYGAYPVSYELSSLDASQDGVLMESLEFGYSGLKRTVYQHTVQDGTGTVSSG